MRRRGSEDSRDAATVEPLSKHYILSPAAAIDDLTDIRWYSAEHLGRENADRLEEFFAKLDLLVRFPRGVDSRVDLIDRPVLFFPAASITPDELVIHAILHSARDLNRVLRQRES